MNQEKIKNNTRTSRYYSYLIGIIIGLVNYFFAPILFLIIGILFFGPGSLLLISYPVKLFTTTIPLFYLIFLIVEIPILSYVVYIVIKKLSKNIRLNFIVLTIVSAIILFSMIPIVSISVQTAENKANPIDEGIKKIDFSDKIVVKDRNSAITKLMIKGDKVIWVEHTKKTPTFPRNVWDLFIFEFDTKSMEAETKKITDLTNAIHKSVFDARIIGDSIYWVEDANLYSISSDSGKILEKEGAARVFGMHNNHLIYSKANGTTTHYIIESDIYKYSLDTKEETKIQGGPPVFLNGKNMCFSDKGKSGKWSDIAIQDIESGSIKKFETKATTEGAYSVDIFACNDKYIIYSFEPSKDDSEKIRVILNVFSFKENRYIVEKSIYDQSWVKAKLIDDTLFFSAAKNNKIISINLLDNKETTVFEGPSIEDWDISEDYLVFSQPTGRYTSNIYLTKLNE